MDGPIPIPVPILMEMEMRGDTNADRENDAVSLRAALQMIEDYDIDFADFFGLAAPPQIQQKQKRKQQQRPQQPPYAKNKRKQEIITLRAQVEELQRSLDGQKAAVTVKDNKSNSSNSEREWQSISMRQQQLRLLAQVENTKLRALVATQSKGAQRTIELAKRLLHLQETIPSYIPLSPISMDEYQGPRVARSTHHERLVRLQQQATQVFSSGSFLKHQDRRNHSFREIHFRDCDHAVSGMEVEFETAWLMPFTVDAVVDAFWAQTTGMKSRWKTFTQSHLHSDATTLMTQFIGQAFGPRAKDNSHGQIAIRRIQRPDGSVLLVSDAQWTGIGILSPHIHSLHGAGWLLVEPVVGLSGAPLTRVKWCRRARVHPAEYDKMTTTQRKQWIGTVIAWPIHSHLDASLDWSVQSVESFLVTRRR